MSVKSIKILSLSLMRLERTRSLARNPNIGGSPAKEKKFITVINFGMIFILIICGADKKSILYTANRYITERVKIE
jgi:hypothetical protein